MSDHVPPELALVQVKDTDGNEVALGASWASHPAVLVFVRHFG